jgi:hypothetical protein
MTTKIFRVASYSVIAMLVIFILLTFRNYGISNDEEVQHVYGRLLLDFYQSGFQDQSAFHYKNLYLYGGFFDLMAALLEKGDVLWVWDMRHLLSAGFGLMGLIAVCKIATTLGSARTGLIALLMLSLTAAWTGAMFTHTKDIPFATCMAWALYYTIQACRFAPKIPLQISLKLGVAVGCALGLRIGGGFAVIYLLLSLLIASVFMANGVTARLQFLAKSSWTLLPAALISFALMAIFWPWGVMSPDHPAEAIKAFSNFSFNMLTIDHGMVTRIGEVPRTYLLHYLWVRLPEVFLLGLLSIGLISFANFQHMRQQLVTIGWVALTPLLIAIVFPLAFVLITKPALYNGVRHFTFVLPPLAVLAGIGIDQAWKVFETSKPKLIALGVVCFVLALSTLVELIQLHPYEYIFYNHLAGSNATAEAEWESDYWSSSLREAAKALQSLPLPTREAPYLVAVCAESVQGSAYLDHRFQVTKDWVAADFFMSSTNMHCDQVLQGEVIAEVRRLGTLLAVVKDRRKLLGEARDPTPAPY